MVLMPIPTCMTRRPTTCLPLRHINNHNIHETGYLLLGKCSCDVAADRYVGIHGNAATNGVLRKRF